MKQAIFTFLWKHILKLISAGFMGFCYLVWSFLQMPYQAAEAIEALQKDNAAFKTEMESIKVTSGVNTQLLLRIDRKQDDLQKAIFKISVQRRNESYR